MGKIWTFGFLDCQIRLTLVYQGFAEPWVLGKHFLITIVGRLCGQSRDFFCTLEGGKTCNAMLVNRKTVATSTAIVAVLFDNEVSFAQHWLRHMSAEHYKGDTVMVEVPVLSKTENFEWPLRLLWRTFFSWIWLTLYASFCNYTTISGPLIT